MAASYISVPRDLTKVKSKVFFNLTKRQLICFGLAVLLGVPSFFALKQITSVNLATFGMMAIMMPLFLMAMYEKHGQPLEVFLGHFISTIFIRPKTRPWSISTCFFCCPIVGNGAKSRILIDLFQSVRYGRWWCCTHRYHSCTPSFRFVLRKEGNKK